MNVGIIEPYSSGFVEVVPEGEGSDYWQIAAIHINGEVFCPSPRLYRSKQAALKKAEKMYDWIANHEKETRGWGCYCENLEIILWHQQKIYPSCPLAVSV